MTHTIRRTAWGIAHTRPAGERPSTDGTAADDEDQNEDERHDAATDDSVDSAIVMRVTRAACLRAP